jgi:DNA-binding response OmpR family regulator
MACNKVLVVEDDHGLRNLTALALEREGLPVATAKDGREALDCLSREKYQVVLLDLMMPRVSGWDVIDWLKDHADARPHSLIVVTAADREVFSALNPEIVNAIIVKPFDIYELAGYVERCCELPADRDRRKKRLIGNP